MKNFIPTTLVRLLLACSLPLTSWAQSAILDPAFGTNGRVLTSFTSGNTTDQAQSVALQPDGKLVVAGYGSGGLEVARYNSIGTLDATFGSGGKVSIEFGALPSYICPSCNQEQSKALSVHVQTDGKIVLGGRRSGQWLATRLLSNGQLDGAFASQGAYTLLAGSQGGEIIRLGQQSSGQIILIGRTSSLNANYPRVVRLETNGTVDAGFTGTVPYNNSTYSGFDGLVDNSDRSVLLGLESFPFVIPTLTPQLVAYRFLPNGQLDPAFGTAGRVALPADIAGYSGGGALVPLPTGQLLVVAANGASLRIARLQADGTPDPSFGTGGVAAAAPLPTARVKRARLQPDGKLVVACISSPASALVPVSATNSTATSITDFTLVRFLANGQFDPTYGVNGMVRIHEDNLDNLSDLAMQADGQAVAVGAAASGSLYQLITNDYALQNSRFAVLRVLPTANCTSVSAGVEQTVCGATTLRLGPSPQPGLTYSWAVSPAVSGFSSTSAAATFTAPQPATSTTYTLTLTATSGTQCSTADQVRITVLPAISPALAIQASATTIVAGQSVTLSVPNPQAGATYVWTGPGLQATTGASVTATPPAGTSAAQYSVTATLGTCSRMAQLLVAVVVPGTPAWSWASRHGNRGDDRTTASATDAAGNTYVTGYFQDSITVGNTRLQGLGDNDIFVAKYNAAGAVVWAQRFGGSQSDQGLTIAVSTQGGVYVGGVFGGTMQVGSTTLVASAFLHMFMARLDASTGAPLWALTNTGTSGPVGNSIRSLTTTASGDVLACGNFTGTLNLGGQQLTGGNNSSWLVACLSDAGAVRWVRAVGNGSDPASALSIDCDNSGNAYVVGMAQGTFTAGPSTIPNSSGAYAVYLVYFSSQGQPQWARSFIGARYNNSPDVTVDAVGNAYVTCIANATNVTFTGATAADSKTVPTTTSRTESYLACYTPSGNPVWARNLATCTATSWNIASAVTARGGFLYAGGWFTGSNTFDNITLPSTTAGYTAFVAKYSLTTGQNIWAQQSALDACAPRDLGIDAAGNSYLVGDFGPSIAFGTTALTSAGSNDGFVAKLGTALLLATPSPRAALAWQLYPNPLSNQQAIHVQLPAPMLVQAYSVYSSVGQLVQHQLVGSTLQSLEIALMQLQQGVYLLRLQTANGVLSKQFIRQ